MQQRARPFKANCGSARGRAALWADKSEIETQDGHVRLAGGTVTERAMKTIEFTGLVVGLGLAISGLEAQVPAPTLDTRAAFMQYVTNYVFRTNIVIVTNYVVVSNAVVTTNFYNAQGQLLRPVSSFSPPVPGLVPIVATKPAEPDPAVVKAQQLQALRDLLVQGIQASSNKVCAAGSFTSNATQQVPIPQGVTSFDRRKSQDLLVAMNRTAEKAAPETVALLLKLAKQFKTDDPQTVVRGDADAATRAFLTANREELDSQLLALVRSAGTELKLRESYNNVMLKGGGLLGAVLGSGPTVDIDAHVAQGLFKAIATHLTEHEALVRRDVSARKTAALREAFKL